MCWVSRVMPPAPVTSEDPLSPRPSPPHAGESPSHHDCDKPKVTASCHSAPYCTVINAQSVRRITYCVGDGSRWNVTGGWRRREPFRQRHPNSRRLLSFTPHHCHCPAQALFHTRDTSPEIKSSPCKTHSGPDMMCSGVPI